MPFTLTMPKLSPTMEEGTIIKWEKQIGDYVNVGDVIFEVATDKATVEYEALDEGWLRQIIIHKGEQAVINQPVAIFTLEKDESIEGYRPDNLIQKPLDEPTKIVSEKFSEGNSHPSFKSDVFEYRTDQIQKRIAATPLAKKIAKENGIDLSIIKGTGPNGRITSRDLPKEQSTPNMTFGSRQVPSSLPGSYEETPLSPMRKVIAKRLQESKSFIPHFYVTQIIDAEPIVIIREQLKVKDVKLSINDFIVKATALTLKQHPALNSGFNSVSQSIIQFKTIDLAIAVSVEAGLFTPIIRHVDYKNLGEIALEVRLLAQKAREGKLTPQEYMGGSFTITNLGMYGISEFQAILNPPQAAILAVGGIQNVPVVKNGNVVPGKTLHLTLSVDHRVIDGVAAALFLKTLKSFLENPASLFL